MDHEQILNDIVAALRGELGQGFSTIRNFVENQGKLLAKQAEDIARSRINGSLKDDDELFHFFLEGLETNAQNMAKAIVMLTALTIEKAWNAIAGVLWGGIRSILSGAGVPGNLLPETPPIHV
ncbi:MAG: hypothetical protein ACJ8E3_08625 [Sphingomicrobium sp.]